MSTSEEGQGSPEGEVGMLWLLGCLQVNGVYDDDGPGGFNGTGAQHGRGPGIIILYLQTK